MSASQSKVVVDHEGDLSSSQKLVNFLGFLFLETDLLEVGILDDLVQSRSNRRVKHFKIWKRIAMIAIPLMNQPSLLLRSITLLPMGNLNSSHLIFESYFPNHTWFWIREFVELQQRYLLSLLSNQKNLRIPTGSNELIVDGLPAHVGIGIVSLFCLSSLVKRVPVPVACGTDPVSLGVAQEWIPWGRIWDESKNTKDVFLLIRMYSMCQVANVCRGSAWNENLESLQVDWKRKTIFHYNLIQYPGILQNHL